MPKAAKQPEPKTKQDEALVKLVMGRQSKLEDEKGPFIENWMQPAADYVAPHRDDLIGSRTKGQKKGTKIYDGTAQGAAVLAADGIHGYHVSPAFPWFKYAMNRKQVNKIPEVRAWLQEIEFNMYMVRARSNFYSEIWSFIYDGLTIGTPALYGEEDIAGGKWVFESVHPGEIYISENSAGEIDVLHRKRKMNARQLVKKFGLAGMPQPVKQAYENNPFLDYDVLHAVFPREERDDRRLDAKSKRFASVWILKAGNYLLRESGFEHFPYQTWRYMRTGKEPYAITPAMLAMADIKGVNLLDKTMLGAAQMALDPPLNVPAHLEGKVEWRPRGQNVMDETGQEVKPALSGANFSPTDVMVERKQRAIKERFHVDTFLMLASLEGRGQRTAYEVSELMAEKAAVLGAELGPLNTELDRNDEYIYDVEARAGRMPPPPDILLELAAKDPALRFDPVYMGPLAQAQRERFSKQGLKTFYSPGSPAMVMVQLKPELLDNHDLDEAWRTLSEIDNLPEEIVVPPDKVAELRKARVEQQERIAQAEALSQGAQTIKTGAEAAQTMQDMGAMGGMGA